MPPLYGKRAVPTPTGAGDVAQWASKVAAWLGIEFANMQRALQRQSRTVVAATTATATDDLILADATGGAFTVTLPTPTTAAVNDMRVTIKRTNGGGNAVTVGATVDGAANPTLGSQYATMTVWCSGGAWWKISAI